MDDDDDDGKHDDDEDEDDGFDIFDNGDYNYMCDDDVGNEDVGHVE